MDRVLGHEIHSNELVLAGIPGFDDANRTDKNVLLVISEWTTEMYVGLSPLAGIVTKFLYKPARYNEV